MNEHFKKWFEDKGDETHRLDYPLNKDSVVFDIGGYMGDFTDAINKRFGCKIHIFEAVSEFARILTARFLFNENISVYHFGLSNIIERKFINIEKDASSIYKSGLKDEKILLIDFKTALELTRVQFIDLCKINIEGSEYPLLKSMIETGAHKICGNIQVQFHTFIEDYEQKYKEIRTGFEKTHYLTYRYPFVWENWRLK